MKGLVVAFFMIFSVSSSAVAQDLMKERIWKLAGKKKSVYFDRGVFHSSSNAQTQILKSIRNSYTASRGYERVVIDFSGNKLPRVYGHIAQSRKMISLDFFNSTMNPNLNAVNSIKFLKDAKFYNIDQDQLSLELAFSEQVSFDIFYLENPARLVIDIKN